MRSRHLYVVFMLAAFAAVAHAEVPPRSASGTTLEIPEAHAALGRVYYVRYPSHTTQIIFTSDAPIEVIRGMSNKVVGYAVSELADGAPTGLLLAGAFRLPVRSLDSGIPLRNQHMAQERFLDAARHPDITFEMTGSRDVELVEEDHGAVTYAMTLMGEMTIRGISKALEVPARITFIEESETTKNAGPGHVMALRCRYTVRRSDFDIGWPGDHPELADQIQLQQAIIFTTVSRESRLRRAEDGATLIRIQRFMTLLRDEQEPRKAYEFARSSIEAARADSEALNAWAWNIATLSPADQRDYELALEAAMRADELEAGGSADVLDTIARIHYEQGDVERAIEWQQRAVEHKETASDPERLIETLNRYRNEAGGDGR